MDRKGWMVAIRYFYRTEASEPGVTLGIVVADEDSDQAIVLFRNDWEDLLAYDPAADVELMAEFQQELQSLAGRSGARSLVKTLSETFGNSLRCSDPQRIRLEQPLAVHAARLASEYLGHS